MNENSTPTIKDVAEKAGVSTATVSRVLSGREFVSQHLIEKVNQTIEDLRYRPSRVARNLRVRKANTIGLVVSDIQNPFFTSIMRGIQDTLLAKGYVLLAANSDENEDQEKVHIETLLAEEVAGIILAPASASHKNYANLIDEGVGLVVIDRIPDRLKANSVLVDNTAGAHTAVEHLISLGHQRIGIITGREEISTTTSRLQGYRTALQDAGIPFAPELVIAGGFRQEGGYQAMNALFSISEPPTAVFSSNNVMTLGALQAIHEKCKRIPDEIALVSFDDMPWAASLQPPLTSVAQPTYEIGTTAAKLLLDQVSDSKQITRRIILEAKLIVRGSTVASDCN